MKSSEIRQLAIGILGEIAPEADLSMLGDDDELREVLDLDSMDFLNFIAGLHKATGADIPETDYKQLSTMGGVVAYLGPTAD